MLYIIVIFNQKKNSINQLRKRRIFFFQEFGKSSHQEMVHYLGSALSSGWLSFVLSGEECAESYIYIKLDQEVLISSCSDHSHFLSPCLV